MRLGERGELPTSVTQVATTAGAQPRVKVDGKGSTKIDLTVSGARKGTPFWLVLGESNNAGWEATVDGTNVGESTLVDGYANGWLVDPSAAGGGPITIHLRWTAQRLVWIGLAVSALAVVACLALVAIDPGRRRRSPPGAVGWSAPALDLATGVPARPMVVVGVATGAAVVFGALGGWLPAVSAAVVGALALWRPPWRRWLALAPAGFMGATVVYTVGKQLRFDLPASLDWPNEFEITNGWTWAAVAAAATLAVAAFVLERPRRPSPAPPGPSVVDADVAVEGREVAPGATPGA